MWGASGRGAPCGVNVDVLSAVNGVGGVVCYTKEGKDSRAHSFGFENQCMTGMGGFRLIACVRKNEKLRHRCN